MLPRPVAERPRRRLYTTTRWSGGKAEIRSPGSFEYAVGYDYQRFWGEDEVWLIQDKTETAQALYGQIRTSREQLEHSSVALGVRYNTTSATFKTAVRSAIRTSSPRRARTSRSRSAGARRRAMASAGSSPRSSATSTT